MWSLTSEKWEGAGSTIRTSHPFNLGSVILECVSAASAFGDPNKEVPKAPYFFGVFLCWIPERAHDVRAFEDDGQFDFYEFQFLHGLLCGDDVVGWQRV